MWVRVGATGQSTEQRIVKRPEYHDAYSCPLDGRHHGQQGARRGPRQHEGVAWHRQALGVTCAHVCARVQWAAQRRVGVCAQREHPASSSLQPATGRPPARRPPAPPPIHRPSTAHPSPVARCPPPTPCLTAAHCPPPAASTAPRRQPSAAPFSSLRPSLVPGPFTSSPSAAASASTLPSTRPSSRPCSRCLAALALFFSCSSSRFPRRAAALGLPRRPPTPPLAGQRHPAYPGSTPTSSARHVGRPHRRQPQLRRPEGSSSLRPPQARTSLGAGHHLRASADMGGFSSPLANRGIRPASEIYFGRNNTQSGNPDEMERAAQQWLADIDQYETTLEEMATATLDQDFKDELSAIEQWFRVLSEAERTAAPLRLAAADHPGPDPLLHPGPAANVKEPAHVRRPLACKLWREGSHDPEAQRCHEQAQHRRKPSVHRPRPPSTLSWRRKAQLGPGHVHHPPHVSRCCCCHRQAKGRVYRCRRHATRLQSQQHRWRPLLLDSPHNLLRLTRARGKTARLQPRPGTKARTAPSRLANNHNSSKGSSRNRSRNSNKQWASSLHHRHPPASVLPASPSRATAATCRPQR